MTVLTPTARRLDLLHAISNGRVVEDWYTDQPGIIRLYPDRSLAGRGRDVTGAVRSMKTAEWCRTNPADGHLHERLIVLTAAGQAVLDDNNH